MGTEEKSLCLQFSFDSQQRLRTMKIFFFTNIFFFLVFGHKFETTEVQQTNGVLLHFRVNEKFVIGNRPEYWILSAQGVVHTSNNAILVSDKLDYKLKKFDMNGKIIVEVGKRGRGPGEFRGPGPLDSYKDVIAVADFASPRVQIFSSSLEYKSGFHAPGPVFDLCSDQEGNLWLGVLAGRANHCTECSHHRTVRGYCSSFSLQGDGSFFAFLRTGGYFPVGAFLRHRPGKRN